MAGSLLPLSVLVDKNAESTTNTMYDEVFCELTLKFARLTILARTPLGLIDVCRPTDAMLRYRAFHILGLLAFRLDNGWKLHRASLTVSIGDASFLGKRLEVYYFLHR